MLSLNISEEKQFIYDMMRDVSKERRQLTDIYYGLKQRLDDLHKLELRGLEDLSIKGYVDLHRDSSRKQSVENIKRESENIINKINKESEQLEENDDNQSKIPQYEISEQRFRDSKSTSSKPVRKAEIKVKEQVKDNNRGYNMERSRKIRKLIPQIIKDEGIPLDARRVWDKLLERDDIDVEDIGIKNFRSNHFFRVTRDNENLVRVSKGFYQYKFNS